MTEQEAIETSLVHTTPWHTSSYSAERGECVEVSEGPVTWVRDTKHRELGVLCFAADEWHAFLGTAKDDLH
ncbi:DUF397 domain-containing protein [Nocardiopsis sp. NPDC006198]|uniref:DUF397 domain-containing protein n=1 Tax=Nocardiopsis sp. NPDC006198 TaxID=3154472 RepID=UPI0033A9531D